MIKELQFGVICSELVHSQLDIPSTELGILSHIEFVKGRNFETGFFIRPLFELVADNFRGKL